MAVGVICEYNPFHRGHLFHLAETKKAFPSETVVCLMSGQIVQRGDIAILDKTARAKMAVLGGADLVLELPVASACASARDFARGGVFALQSIGVKTLSFGSEAGDVSPLVRAAALLDEPLFDRKIKENYDLGLPYALARQKTFDELAPALALVLKTPNNLLAIEYIRAAEGLLAPFTVPRRGAPHDGAEGEDLSASLIREELRAGAKVPYSMPEFARTIYLDEAKAGRAPVFLENAERAVLSHLRRMTAEDFRALPDTGEGLSERIVSAIADSAALSEVADKAKTKRYAHSRIRRILTRAYFGLTADLPVEPPYLRVLAFNERGREFLRNAKKDGPELLTRPSDLKRMSREAQKLGELESKITDLYGLFMPAPALCGDEWRRTPVYVV